MVDGGEVWMFFGPLFGVAALGLVLGLIFRVCAVERKVEKLEKAAEKEKP